MLMPASAAQILKLESYREDQHGPCSQMTHKFMKRKKAKVKEKVKISFDNMLIAIHKTHSSTASKPQCSVLSIITKNFYYRTLYYILCTIWSTNVIKIIEPYCRKNIFLLSYKMTSIAQCIIYNSQWFLYSSHLLQIFLSDLCQALLKPRSYLWFILPPEKVTIHSMYMCHDKFTD